MSSTIKNTVITVVFALMMAMTLAISPFTAKTAYGQEKTAQVAGKSIVVDLSEQRLVAYEGKKQVFSTLVLTGRPELPTPTGSFTVFRKVSPTTFYSPWPEGSANWYAPTRAEFALEFAEGGFFLHDSWWHTVYGPGTNAQHYDPVYGWQSGSHGCVSMPVSASSWLYRWAPIGTSVVIKP